MNNRTVLKILNNDYSLRNIIRDTFYATSYYAFNPSGDHCIVKIFKTGALRPSDLIRFKQDYETVVNLDIDGIIRISEIGLHQNNPAIVSEYYEPFYLSDFMLGGTVPLPDFFRIALRLTGIVSHLHKHGIFSIDLRPGNIVYAADGVYLADTGSSVIISGKNESLYRRETLREFLPYVSPEQTGRMNRTADYRSDLYSLGIVFYEILTGRPPFYSDDPMEMVHFHMARNAPRPCDVKSDIPAVLSDIISKLIEKSPESRYQNINGLLADLVRCSSQLTAQGRIDNFRIGLDDVSHNLTVPDTLVGRTEELGALKKAYLRIGSSEHEHRRKKNRIELALVTGGAGCGKSFLINEIRKFVLGEKGYFISGKHYEFHQNTPYSAIIEALRGMIRHILSESDESIGRWRSVLKEALGDNGRVITDIIPDMEILVGRQPSVPELGAEAAQNRLNYIFVRFISVLASMSRGLVIFIDDIQWMDTASANLIRSLLRNGDIAKLMVVLVCRTEGNDDVSVYDTIIDACGDDIPLTRIDVKPLDPAETVSYTRRFITLEKKDAEMLGEIIHRKTGGNPFYINQLMKILHDTGTILYRPGSGWHLNAGSIDEIRIVDNVITLISERIKNMGAEEKRILAVCSCLGSEFEIETVAEILGTAIDDVLNTVRQGVEQGILLHNGNNYEFAHDRIHEAVYSLINADEKASIHLKTGRIMLAGIPEERIEQYIDSIVNQFENALPAVSSPGERLTIARLNFTAAKKAIGSAAYESSLVYMKESLELAGDKIWDNDYNFALTLYMTAAKAAYMAADFIYMDEVTGIALRNIRSQMERIFIYQMVIQAHYACNRMQRGLQDGLDVLRLLKHPLPEKPRRIHVIAGLVKTRWLLKGRSIESLLAMDDMSDPRIGAAFNTITNMSISAYKSSPLLLPMIIFKAVRFSVRYGHAPETAYTFAGYGMILCGALGDIESGVEYGNLALKLSERESGREFRPRTLHLIYCMIWHWKHHLRDTLDMILDACRLGMETGDIQDATSSANIYCVYKFLCGFNLDEVKHEMSHYEDIIRRFRQETNLNYLRIERQAVICLTEYTADPCNLSGEAYDDTIMLPVHESAGDRTAIAIVYFLKMILCYLFGKYDESVSCSEKAGEYIDALVGLVFIPVYHFYDSLARLACYDSASSSERKVIIKKVKSSLDKLHKWSFYAPMNHGHKYDLVKAELLRVTGGRSGAAEYYESAINGALENNYIQEAAVASECAAKYYISAGLEKAAAGYLESARRLYDEWGAAPKVRQFDSVYPGFAEKAEGNTASQMPPDGLEITVARGLNPSLDYSVLINALQSISGEIVLDRFIENLMRLIIETAGAERGILIVDRNDELYIAAEGHADIDISVIRKPVKLSEYNLLPLTVINYSARTGEAVVLGNAVSEGDFTADEYLLRTGSRSVLCIPLVRQHKLKGLIYLENSLATDVFMVERVEILKLLSTQAAISLENAILFERALTAESEIQEQLEEMQSQFEEMEAMNEEIHTAYQNLDQINSRLEEESRMLSIFRQFAESAAQGMVITDLNGAFIYTNPAFCRMTGIDCEKSSGKNVLDFIPEDKKMHIVKKVVPVVLEKGETIEELSFNNFMNLELSAILTISLLREKNGAPMLFANIITDITKIREAENILRESEERYRILVETMNDGLCVLDNSGLFTYLNKSLCNMLGYAEDELLGKHITSLLDSGNRSVFEKEFLNRKEGDSSIYELEWRTRDGEILSTIVSPKPVYNSAGSIVASFGVITNISDRIKAEKEKERIQAQLLHSQKMEAVGTLAGGIAHDFNNMLTSIFGNTDLLLMDMKENDPAYSLVREIAKAAEKSASLTRQLLTFSRKQILETSYVDLNSVILEMEKMLERLIGEDIDLTVRLDQSSGVINADKSQIEQILLNLAVNARDAMPDGGRLQITTSVITIDDELCGVIPESRKGRFVVLRIEDSGTGMDSELIKNIFEPFFTTKETNRGTGLGLAVVYGIVKQHDGWINVKSSVGEGTVFTVYLPVSSSVNAVPQTDYKTRHLIEGRRGNGERILLVEDQEDVRRFVKNALTGFGYNVYQAEDIKSAISMFVQEKGGFDLLLSDIVLPDGKGIFLADNLLEKNPLLKIILSSGYTEQKFQLKVINEKHYNFLPKPYTLNTLLDMVKKVLTSPQE